jgi:hypothetical protein
MSNLQIFKRIAEPMTSAENQGDFLEIPKDG